MQLGRRLRKSLRALRHAPDRLVHPVRRSRLLKALATGEKPRSVLFVCHGNICRSPYAEKSFARAVSNGEGGMGVASAGFIGPDRPSPDAAIRVAGTLGIDLGLHRSQLLSRENTEDVDLVIVMDKHQARWMRRYFNVPRERIILLGDLDPSAIETRRIKDPVDQPDEEFLASYERIERCVRTLARSLGVRDASQGPERNGNQR